MKGWRESVLIHLTEMERRAFTPEFVAVESVTFLIEDLAC